MNGSGGFVNSLDDTINAGTWYFATYVYDGTDQSVWLNGVKLASNTENSSGDSGANDGVSLLSEKSVLPDGFSSKKVPAKIDELGLWDKALSDQEVQDLYNSGSGNPFN